MNLNFPRVYSTLRSNKVLLQTGTSTKTAIHFKQCMYSANKKLNPSSVVVDIPSNLVCRRCSGMLVLLVTRYVAIHFFVPRHSKRLSRLLASEERLEVRL
jgi:hypothetical protein